MTDISLTSSRRSQCIIVIRLIRADTLTQETRERSAGLTRFPLLPRRLRGSPCSGPTRGITGQPTLSPSPSAPLHGKSVLFSPHRPLCTFRKPHDEDQGSGSPMAQDGRPCDAAAEHREGLPGTAPSGEET